MLGHENGLQFSDSAFPSSFDILEVLPYAAVVIGPAGEVLASNSLARRMTESELGIYMGLMRPEGMIAAWVHRFHAERKQEERVYVAPATMLRLSRFREKAGSALLSIREVDDGQLPSVDELTRLFDLSATQSALLRSLITGAGLPVFSKRHGIPYETARYHAKRLNEVFGCGSQVELVGRICRMIR
jgi:DNA-binding CsgD family transcriptional regulator